MVLLICAVFSIIIFIFMAAILTGAKTYFSKNVLVEKLFRYLETFKHAKYSGANVKEVSNQIKTAFGYGNYRSDDFEGILETTRIDEKASRGKSEPKLPNCEDKVEVPHPLASMERGSQA